MLNKSKKEFVDTLYPQMQAHFAKMVELAQTEEHKAIVLAGISRMFSMFADAKDDMSPEMQAVLLTAATDGTKCLKKVLLASLTEEDEVDIKKELDVTPKGTVH